MLNGMSYTHAYSSLAVNTVESPFNICLGVSIFIPLSKKNIKWGLCHSHTEKYCCSYKIIAFTLNLNLIMFFLSPFYIQISVFILWDI